MEREIFYLGTRTFKKKDGTTLYVIDYQREDNKCPQTDYLTALEFTEINKKMKGKERTSCVGILAVGLYDKLYVCAIK